MFLQPAKFTKMSSLSSFSVSPNYTKSWNVVHDFLLEMGSLRNLEKQLSKQRFESPVNGEAPLKLAFAKKCHVSNTLAATYGLMT